MSTFNNNNNNVPIGKHFRVSWYTKQSSELFNGQNKESTYTEEEETIFMQWVESTYD